MKKCPECGNPSYDGAPVCGNCGFKFPKPKVAAPKQESIFERAPKEKKSPSKKSKSSGEPSTIDILKKNRLLIGIILLITLIVICGIVLTGSNNNNSNGSTPAGDLAQLTNGDFSFKYPGSWQSANGTDESHEGAKFFNNGNGTIIEYYNSTLETSSLKDITQERISYAQESGAYIELVETVTLDGKNATNIILANADGTYTRFVSMFGGDILHVFKITGPSIDSITTEEINSVINSANVE